MGEIKRFLGLELSGAKNQKTSLAVLEFYPKEKKAFLLETYDRIASQDGKLADEVLLEIIEEIQPKAIKMGVNVPLELPPCVPCTRKTCPLPGECTVPEVEWMKNLNFSQKNFVKEFTPYTQRPIELWVKKNVLGQLPEEVVFEIDETLGGNRAPLTARMHFLKRHLDNISLIEVWPKLTVSALSIQAGLDTRLISGYRSLEEGIHCREEILDFVSDYYGIFIYERDFRKLSQSLANFDAFICAFTALLSDQNLCTKIPAGFPINSGWVNYPILEQKK